MTSTEKVAALFREYTTRQPQGAQEAMAQIAVRNLGPHYLALLPEDPEQLDALLDQLAAMVLGLKSDPPTDAPQELPA